MAVIRRAFQNYGYFCASRPWEILTAMVTAMICLVTMYRQPLSAASAAKAVLSEKDYLGAGMLAMTMMRCGSILYCYRQMKMLNRMGSRYVPGIAGVFAIHCSILLSTVLVKCFDVDLSDLRDALFVFAFLLDLGRASLLAQYSLLAKSFSEIREQIGKGMGILGPEITLDTLVEVLVIGVGTLSGVRRLEVLCYFACLSVLVRYFVFLTFFPALLSLFLELSQCHERPTNEQFMNLKKLFSGDTSKPNPVVERVKIIMALGLSAVHVGSRWGGEPPNLFCSSSKDDLFGRFGPVGSGQELEFPFSALRWISLNAEHLVLLTLLCTLIAKSFLGKESVEEFRLALLNADTDSENERAKISRVSSTSGASDSPRVRVVRKCRSSSCLRRRKMSFACLVSRNRAGLQAKESGDSVTDIFFPRDRSVSTSSNVTFVLGDSESSGNASDEDEERTIDSSTQTDEVRFEADDETKRALDDDDDLEGKRRSGEIRPMESLLQMLASDDNGGPAALTDAEVLHLVKHKHIASYQLENALNDPLRGVQIRRAMYEESMSEAMASGLKGIPFQLFDYDQVNGACCENVVGYVGVPVGLVGPLLVDSESLYVPMATTEGCLVASTNRGARAIRAAAATTRPDPAHFHPDLGPDMDCRAGVRTALLDDGMTRGPLVRFPSAVQASECQNWLQSEAGHVYMTDAFNATSRFARLRRIQCRVAGRFLFIRFVATTGDAMGMNMLSKGCEEALKMLSKKYPLMEIMSVSGNYCADKKSAAVNWIEGRGKSVVCEARIPGSVVKHVLKTDVDSLVDLNIGKNLVGSAMAGSIGGFNAHAANIVAAIFIACGQDPAQVVASASCITLMERCGPMGEDLYISVTLPSLEVGTVGGGTILSAQSSCLKMLGVQGAGEEPGANARRLARIVGATVLAGELSLMSALSAGHLVKSHLKHNRSSLFMSVPQSQAGPSASNRLNGFLTQPQPPFL